MYPPPDQWQFRDHLQRRLAQGHIWSLPLCTITAPFFVSPLRLNYFQVFVSYCWKNTKWIFKVGEGKRNLWWDMKTADGRVIVNCLTERVEEKKKEENGKWCDTVSYSSLGFWEESCMHDSRLASAVFMQYNRQKEEITEHLITEGSWAGHCIQSVVNGVQLVWFLLLRKDINSFWHGSVLFLSWTRGYATSFRKERNRFPNNPQGVCGYKLISWRRWCRFVLQGTTDRKVFLPWAGRFIFPIISLAGLFPS